MIAVSGPGLDKPVEITDRLALHPFLPWGRAFIDWGRGIIPDPAPGMKTYQVQFYLDRDESPIYVIEYAPEPQGGPGYVYIPPSDLNMGTILTGDSDYWDPNRQVAPRDEGLGPADAEGTGRPARARVSRTAAESTRSRSPGPACQGR